MSAVAPPCGSDNDGLPFPQKIVILTKIGSSRPETAQPYKE